MARHLNESEWAVAACVLPVAVAAGLAHGQCTPGWLTQMGTPGTVQAVRVTAELPNGDIIVGGDFTSIGGVAASHIARYTPSTNTWAPLGSGTNSAVHSLLVLGNEDLLVGGSFWNAGGVATWGIARYRPSTSTWSAIGSVVGTVYLLMLEPSGDVLVGGTFMGAGTATTANYIARWNPTTGTWSAMPGGSLSSSAYGACVLPDGDLIVGGSFDRAGGLPALRIARYDVQTNTWSALGAGTSASVEAVTRVASGDVIVGGGFTSAGGLTANCIARYSPETHTWATIPGAGGVVGVLGGAVYTQTLLPSGEVVVAGGFASAGNVAGTSRIALLQPATNTWLAMGSGVNDNVYDVKTVQGGDVIAGGGFTSASGAPAARVARYTLGIAAPVVTEDPYAATLCPDEDASFAVIATGGTSYAWRKGTLPISPAINPSAATATLIIAGAGPEDEGLYDCVVSNACFSDTSAAAELVVRDPDDPACNPCPGCPADYDLDGGVTGGDIAAFFTDWEQGLPCADVDIDGGITFGDVAAFFGAFEAGGC